MERPDVVMRRMSGRELALEAERRKLALERSICPATDDVTHHGVLGRTAFINKPFSHNAGKVRQALDGRRPGKRNSPGRFQITAEDKL